MKVGGESDEMRRCLDGITDSMDMSLSELQEMVKDSESSHVTAHEVGHTLSNWTARDFRCILKSRNASVSGSYKKLETVKKGISSYILLDSMTLLTAWLWNSHLQKCEKKSFYSFKPPSLWFFPKAALGT